jgi:hypothetical protein
MAEEQTTPDGAATASTDTASTGSGTPAPRGALPKWRRILVGVLVVVGCVLAPLSVLSVWMKSTLLNTDNYVSTVGPLASDPDVQQALANRITNAIVQNTDIESKIADALPSKAAFVAPAVAAGLEQYVNQAALKLVQSDQFDKLWVEANARAHPQIVALLEGGGGKRVSTKDGQIVLTLGPIAAKVQGVLEKAGIDVFSGSGSTPTIVLFTSSDLKSAQSITDLLQKSAWVLSVLTILAFAVAIGLSGNRRRTILRASLGLALGMGLLLVLFNTGRHFYLDALPATVSRPAATAVYDQLLTALRLSLRTGFVLAIVVALGAWLSGPGSVATKIREGTLRLVRGHDTGEEPSGLGVWVAGHKNPLRLVVVGVALLILVVINAPTPAEVLVLAIIVILLMLLIEFLGRAVRTADTAA